MQLVDVRAPVEVARGAFPDAWTLPILVDGEREAVGTCYRQHGPVAAVELGMQLTREHRDSRVTAWRDAVERADRPVAFTCWRGGDRSRIAQEWLGDVDVARVRGGTKALRRFLMECLPEQVAATRTVVLAGLTGSGKTEVLHALAAEASPELLVMDLEGLANHRGSAFGGFANGQPAQQTFDHHVASALRLAAPRLMVAEDESRNIGRVRLPPSIWSAIAREPVVMLEAPMHERIARIAQEYVFDATEDSHGVSPVSSSNAVPITLPRAVVRARLTANLEKIGKRLGAKLLKNCIAVLDAADSDARWFTVEAHAAWIEALLQHYYDPLYLRSLSKLDRPVLFQGSDLEIRAWLQAESQTAPG